MFKFYVLLIPFFRAHCSVLYARLGQDVTLPCFCDTSVKHLCWYKQVAGEPPQIVSSVYRHLANSNSFHNRFKDDTRFSVHVGAGFYHLNISDVQEWDSGMYYCGQTSITVTEFDSGIFLVLTDFIRTSFVLQQPQSEFVKAGDPVTLNCTLHTGAIHMQHSVFWFKEELGDPHRLGIVYVHTRSGGGCAPGPVSPTARSCVFSLREKSVSTADAGTYYCAVASCGRILFGNGSRLEVRGSRDDPSSVSMLCGAAALLVSVVLNGILIGILCKVCRRKYLYSGGPPPKASVKECITESPNEEPGDLQYVALDFKQRQSRRQRSTKEETVYSGVRISNRK